MKIHLYSLCWNEADILDFFFRHYDPWVDRYFIFDDGSTDGSIDILKAHPKVDWRKWKRSYPDSYLISQTDWLNTAWKESRGIADWVVIVDIDEHLLTPHHSIRNYLGSYKAKGITHIPALGFQMITKEFPNADENLAQTRTRGTPLAEMCKLSIINPDAIEESNFTGGRHTATPLGNLKLPKRDELLLLHYKYLGTKRTLDKISGQYDNMQSFDTNTGLLLHFGWSREKLSDHLRNVYNSSADMEWSNFNPNQYPYYYRWWRIKILHLIFCWCRRAKRFIFEPDYMIKRLRVILSSRKHNLPSEKFSLLIEKINQSPVRKKIYNQITRFYLNKASTVITKNGKENKGSVILIQRALNADELLGMSSIYKAVSAKKENEEKHQHEFEAFVLTNSKGFANDAIELANKNNIELVTGNNLIEFISRV
jgi:glycosyltransferase involved in cell wall biosynthesis